MARNTTLDERFEIVSHCKPITRIMAKQSINIAYPTSKFMDARKMELMGLLTAMASVKTKPPWARSVEAPKGRKSKATNGE